MKAAYVQNGEQPTKQPPFFESQCALSKSQLSLRRCGLSFKKLLRMLGFGRRVCKECSKNVSHTDGSKKYVDKHVLKKALHRGREGKGRG